MFRFARWAAAALIVVTMTGCAVGADDVENAPYNQNCTTATSIGKIAGRVASDVCTYKGIPYAAPPTGDRRFLPPQQAARWKGTLQATDGSRVCPQYADPSSEDYPDDKKIYTDENCLYLNITVPKNTRANRPVIVFIHGGAAIFGNANEARYDGSTLATKGNAIVVTLNYRLGVLGWTELGGLDPKYRGSGNNGLRDQIAALTWVRQHIGDFGGNPDNVTAVGESEGAFSLGAMLATDNPQRLFRRVILESGSGYLVRSASLEKKNTTSFFKATDIRSIAQLKALSIEQLLGLQEKALEASAGAIGRATYFGAYIDGQLVKAPTIQRVTSGYARGIDLIVGTNRDEFRYFAQFDPPVLDLTQQQYSVLFPTALAYKRDAMIATYAATHKDVVMAMINDQGLRVPAIRLAEAQSRWARSYVYQFDWAPKNAKSLGAIHTAELPFVFGTLRFTGIPGGAQALQTDRKNMTNLSNHMIAAWTSFARSGKPGWPTYRTANRATMIWNYSPKIVNGPNDKERAAWDGYDFPALDLNIRP